MSILSRFACPLHNSTTPSSRHCLFFCNDTATTEIYTLSLHDALPILCGGPGFRGRLGRGVPAAHAAAQDRKSTRLNSSHVEISYAVFCLKKKRRLSKIRKGCRGRVCFTSSDADRLTSISKSRSGVRSRIYILKSAACCGCVCFFLNDTATTGNNTLSLHDALPI